jgi:hypothetical protein
MLLLLGEQTKDGGGIVVAFVTRSLVSVPIHTLNCPHTADELLWSVFGQQIEQARPVEEVVRLDRA